MFLVGEGFLAVALDLVEELIHAAFVGLLAFGLAEALLLGAFLQPALPEADLFLGRRRGRLALAVAFVALQAGVALGEIVAEERVFSPGLQHDQLLGAGPVDEPRQEQRKDVVYDEG